MLRIYPSINKIIKAKQIVDLPDFRKCNVFFYFILIGELFLRFECERSAMFDENS